MKNDFRKEQSKKLYKVQQLLKDQVISLDDLAEIVPGMLHVNNKSDLAMTYLSKIGCDTIGYELEQIQALGADIFEKHVCEYTRQYTYVDLFNRIQANDQNEIISFYQDWKYVDADRPKFLFTTTKSLSETQTISISLFPEHTSNFTDQINDLFGINKIFDLYFGRFQSLSKREKEVLLLLGKDLRRKEIAELLFISDKTVKKHCENIFRKLGTSTRKDIRQIGLSFSNL